MSCIKIALLAGNWARQKPFTYMRKYKQKKAEQIYPNQIDVSPGSLAKKP